MEVEFNPCNEPTFDFYTPSRKYRVAAVKDGVYSLLVDGQYQQVVVKFGDVLLEGAQTKTGPELPEPV